MTEKDWLPRITATTPYQEILSRPSALNPYPSRIVDGTFQVTSDSSSRMPTPRSNFHVLIKYAPDDIVKGQMPVRFAVEQADMPPADSPAKPQDTSWRTLDETLTFVPVQEALLQQAPALATRYMAHKERDEIQHARARVIGDYTEDTAYIDAQPYLGRAVATHQEYIEQGRPGVALDVAHLTFAGRTAINGKVIRISGLVDRRKEMLLNLIVPEMGALDRQISENLDNDALFEKYYDLERDFHGVDVYAAEVLKAHLARQAAASAAQLEPPIVAQKLTALADREQGVINCYLEGLRNKARSIPGKIHDPAELQARVASNVDFPAWLVNAILQNA